jgi:phage shock protein A
VGTTGPFYDPMKLVERIRRLLRVAVNDLIGEEPLPPEDEVGARITAVAPRLAQLRNELAAATVREKRAEREHRTALVRLNELNQVADKALGAGQEAEARRYLAQADQLLASVDSLQDRYLTYAQASLKLRAEIETLEAQLTTLRRQHESLADQEGNVAMLEKFNQARREQRQEVKAARDNLDALKERLAIREDHLAAWDEVEERGLKDE